MGLGVVTLAVVVLVGAAWASFWGALAANLAMSRGGPAGLGVRWGLLLGPFGLGVVMAKTRGGGRGIDGRVSAGKEMAGRYSTKARASVEAWRGAEVRPAAAPLDDQGRALSDPSRHEPPAWVPRLDGAAGASSLPADRPAATPVDIPASPLVAPADPALPAPSAGPVPGGPVGHHGPGAGESPADGAPPAGRPF